MEPGVLPSPPLSPPSPGATLLGKYHLGPLLGRGSFAKVYKAHSLADNTTVAVKIIDKAKTVNAELERCIVREIAAMRRLYHHPNILKIHEVMATKSKIYLVVEFAAGGELLTKLSRCGRFSENTSRRYFQQLVSALIFSHENGVVHRDVKPQNLLLDEDGNLKVSDFGLSGLPEEMQSGLLHTVCGTPAYSAPEVMLRRSGGSGYNGAKADAWSCGVILFVLLAGALPFNDTNLPDMYRRIHRREYRFPAWIKKPARYVIHHLLDPNPDTRMSMGELVENSWFKKCLSSKQYKGKLILESMNEKVSEMNAFDIISMSSGLDLSRLFEATERRKEKRFTTSKGAREVEERMREIGEELGYEVEMKVKERVMVMEKGRMVLVVEVKEVEPPLLMIEVRVIKEGMEFEEMHWRNLEAKLHRLISPMEE